MLSLAVILAASTIDADSAGLVTELVTASLAKHEKLDVIASADVRRQLEVEADKQVMGCAEETSCLAELANAMGARFVVYGKLGTLDDVVILTLNLFDSDKAQAAGRVVAKDKSLSGLSDRVEATVNELASQFVARLPEGERARVLVLDVEAPTANGATAAAPPSEPPSEAPSPFLLAGAGAIAGGAVAAVVGAFMLSEAASRDSEADKLPAIQDPSALYRERDGFATVASIAFAIGGAGVAGGVGLLVYSFME